MEIKKKFQIDKNVNRYIAWSVLFPITLIKAVFDIFFGIFNMPVLVMKHIDNSIEATTLNK